MRIISHRGNLNGPDPDRENSSEALLECRQLGLDVEVDVWGESGDLWLGHDAPVARCPSVLLKGGHAHRMWFHCKNVEALEVCLRSGLHCFAHQSDPYTLTSKGYIWCLPGRPVPKQVGVRLIFGLNPDPCVMHEYEYSVCVDDVRPFLGR